MIQLSNSDYAALVGERDQLAVRVAAHRDALQAAAAYVELFTPNGVHQQPPSWAIKPDGDFDAEVIAERARAALAEPEQNPLTPISGAPLRDDVEWTRVRGALATFLAGVSSRSSSSKWTARQWESFVDGQLCTTEPFKALRKHLSTPLTWLADCDDAEFDRRIDAFMAGEPFAPGPVHSLANHGTA